MPHAVASEAAESLIRADPSARADQRQSERRELSSWALVTVIGTPSPIHRAQVRNLSERGTQILVGEPLQPSALVKVEYEDNLLLGEVIYCRQEEFGYLAGLRIEHALFGLSVLSDAMQAF